MLHVKIFSLSEAKTIKKLAFNARTHNFSCVSYKNKQVQTIKFKEHLRNITKIRKFHPLNFSCPRFK